MKMKELKTESRIYLASDNKPEYTEQMNKYLLVPDKLVLKVGAQVRIFTCCLEKTLFRD